MVPAVASKWNRFCGTNCVAIVHGDFRMTCILLIVLGFVANALSITITYYSDDKCRRTAGNLIRGQPNPLVIPLNACVRSASTLWTKAISCDEKAKIEVWGDEKCTSTYPLRTSLWTPGECTTYTDIKEAPAMMLTCSSASEVSATVFVAIAIFFATCI